MKIRSKFKDYYDYVGQRYGEDPEVVYNRGKVANAGELKSNSWSEFRRTGRQGHNPFDRISQSDEKNKTEYDLQYIVAGSLVFPVVKVCRRTDYPNVPSYFGMQYEYSFRPLDEELFIWMAVRDNSSYAYYSHRTHGYVPRAKAWEEFQLQLNSDAMKKMCRELIIRCQTPVLKVHHPLAATEIAEHTPILSDHGIPALCAPEAMWQNIYATFTNVLRKNPDKEVPVQLSEKDRIVKAGFDLKTSFRNPINPKPKRRTK